MAITRDLAGWCQRLIATPSVTTSGTRQLAELCARELLAPAGIQARLIASDTEGPEQVNLVAVIEGSDSSLKPLVLNTHLDTVPAGESSTWTACEPWKAKIDGDKIYGLGAADTKLDFVAKALAVIGCGKPRRTVYLVGSFGEEHGLRGAKEMVRRGLLPKAGLAFVGEPSNLQVITAHKGLLVFELEIHPGSAPVAAGGKLRHRAVFTGKSAHSSTPQLGVNAIRLALAGVAAGEKLAVVSIRGGDAVNKVPARCDVVVAGAAPAAWSQVSTEPAGQGDLQTLISSQVMAAALEFIDQLQRYALQASVSEQDYAMPTLTCNAGVIESAAGSLTIQFELRPPPSLPMDSVVSGVEALVAHLGKRFAGLQFALACKRANPGFRALAGSETVALAMDAMARAGLALDSGVKAGCTEAGIYAATGLQPVVFGPGLSVGVVHAPNEYNLLSQVEAATRFYRELLNL